MLSIPLPCDSCHHLNSWFQFFVFVWLFLFSLGNSDPSLCLPSPSKHQPALACITGLCPTVLPTPAPVFFVWYEERILCLLCFTQLRLPSTHSCKLHVISYFESCHFSVKATQEIESMQPYSPFSVWDQHLASPIKQYIHFNVQATWVGPQPPSTSSVSWHWLAVSAETLLISGHPSDHVSL